MRGSERAHDADDCVACGKPLRITGTISLRFHTVAGGHIGWHAVPPCEHEGWNATRLMGEATQPNREKAN